MKIKIDYPTEVILKDLKGKFLFQADRILLIENFTIEERYITDMKLLCYNAEDDFVGHFQEDGCKFYIEKFNLYELRKNWLLIERQLELFGITKNKRFHLG
jgi:hypothetical protein